MSRRRPAIPAAHPNAQPHPNPRTRQSTTFYSLLDQLRGIAALLVVWAHLVGYFLDASDRSWLPFSVIDRFFEKPLAIVESFGWFGVALFFFISGSSRTRPNGRPAETSSSNVSCASTRP